MGREIKRVPLDFEWPMDQVWTGYINPYSDESRDCSFCGGSGSNVETKKIEDSWYDFEKTGEQWCNNITQDEVERWCDQARS